MMQLARRLPALGVQVDIVPRFFEALGPNASLTSIEAIQLVSLPPTRMSRDALLLKRAFDVVGSLVLLVLLRPFFAAIAVWIKRDSPGPVLFRQTRLGLDQRPFTALKFRTMRSDTSPDEHREYIRRAMDVDATPEESGLYKLERPDVGHAVRPLAAKDEPRRAAAALQRPARRHVARRPAALHPVRDRALRASPLRALLRAGRASRACGR